MREKVAYIVPRFCTKSATCLCYLPKELKEQAQSALRAAWQLPAEKGKAHLEKLARWLGDEYPAAAASIAHPRSNA